MLKMKTLSFAAVLVTQFWVAAPAQDIATTQKTLADIQQKLSRIRLLAPALTENERASASLAAVLTTASEDLSALRKRVTDVEDDFIKKVAAGFAELPVLQNTVWRVAPRHQKFLTTLPGDLTVSRDADVTIIKKTGNPLNRPVTPSPSYHVCPSFGLADGDRVSIRISIPPTVSRGGTPVPYYGVRDAEGNEFVLGFLVDSGEEHTLWIQCLGTDAVALADGVLATQGHRVNELVPPLFVFFHMNDTAQLNVHELRLGRPPDGAEED